MLVGYPPFLNKSRPGARTTNSAVPPELFHKEPSRVITPAVTCRHTAAYCKFSLQLKGVFPLLLAAKSHHPLALCH